MLKRKITGVILAAVLILAIVPAIPAHAQGAKTTVYANTAEELENAIASNTEIILSGTTYSYEYQLMISGVENLSIVGVKDTKIVSTDAYSTVVQVVDSRNVSIEEVFIGHDVPPDWGCGDPATVIGALNVEDLAVENCSLYGCSVIGFNIQSSSARFSNSIIWDCSMRIGHMASSDVVFDKCTFKNNGYGNEENGLMSGYDTYALWVLDNDWYYEYSNPDALRFEPLMTFNGCEFIDNNISFFKNEYGMGYKGALSYNSGMTEVNDCTFTNNAWQSAGTDEPGEGETGESDVGKEAAPDSWAQEEVNAALEAGLVPDVIGSGNWRGATSRLNAAEAIVLLIEKACGMTMDEMAEERGWDLDTNQFSDTDSQAVTFLKYAEVTSGVGDNKYDPAADYNRAQIVTMIGRAAEVFFDADAQGENPFTGVPDWAAPFVGYAAENGITQGVGEGLFDSLGVLQNQQTVVFCYRAFNVWK